MHLLLVVDINGLNLWHTGFGVSRPMPHQILPWSSMHLKTISKTALFFIGFYYIKTDTVTKEHFVKHSWINIEFYARRLTKSS